ncbi:DUF6286 domain-containing protein [Zafaria sp. Z1313]|uniref:DUF6286 domain-containing protein n=1 Tax=unclassified Zafaria TaxID=2828765 RepID=UPI002E791D1B|nr:DUF6286 domain-containing protein [Zafaria sp. J156]MEE1621837.1 DUF6286 domain-containing protein [Zafaria sp. J156]
MTPEDRARIEARELTSARSGAAITAAVVVALLCLYLMFEAAMKSIGQPAWVKSPDEWWAWLSGLPGTADPFLLAAGSLAVLALGLFLLLSGLLPGRRARHAMPDPRAVVIVDNEVIAATLARRARLEAGVAPEQVLVVVSRQLVEVQVRPTSGIPVAAGAVQAAVEDELRTNRIDPLPEVKVRIAESGVVGQ